MGRPWSFLARRDHPAAVIPGSPRSRPWQGGGGGV